MNNQQVNKLTVLYFVLGIATGLIFGIWANSLTHKTTPKPQADTNQLYIERLQAKNELLLNLVNELDSIASKTKQTAIVYRTRTEYIRLHDTLNQRFTDSSYCHDLERENTNLWYLAELDSTEISTLKRVVSNDSLSLIECGQVVAKVQDRANNEAKKANKRLGWIKSLGIVAILEGLIIAVK